MRLGARDALMHALRYPSARHALRHIHCKAETALNFSSYSYGVKIFQQNQKQLQFYDSGYYLIFYILDGHFGCRHSKAWFLAIRLFAMALGSSLLIWLSHATSVPNIGNRKSSPALFQQCHKNGFDRSRFLCFFYKKMDVWF